MGIIWHSLWHGFASAVSSSPWLGVLLALGLLGAVVQFVRSVIHSGPRDPVRRFTRGDKAVIVRRAGGQCEHHGWSFGRCRATDNLEADHVHPHSRGGWTNISNGQALCKRHNRLKRASVPYWWQLRGLAKRRVRYFPAGESGAVIRRAMGSRATSRRR